MDIDKYKDLRHSYQRLVYEINEKNKHFKNFVLRAADRFGLVKGNAIILDNDEESNVLMDYILYEKNGKSNRLVDRHLFQYGENLDQTNLLILNGMVNNHYSLFEIKHIDKDNSTLVLYDLLNKEDYSLIDIGFAHTARTNMILATRLIPIEDINMTSGQTFAFDINYRLRILTTISRIKNKRKRRTSIKTKIKKSHSKTLLEIMFDLHKKFGTQILTLDPK